MAECGQGMLCLLKRLLEDGQFDRMINMKYVVASDLHGGVFEVGQLCEQIVLLHPDKVILLGDLYGGGSCDEVDKLLLGTGFAVECVEGNCDYRYVGMSGLDFSGSQILEHFGKRKYFFTHGHIYNKYTLPSFMKKDDVFIYGHTHMCGISEESGVHIVNAGSVSKPRGNTKKSFIFMEGKTIEIKELNSGETIYKLEL